MRQQTFLILLKWMVVEHNCPVHVHDGSYSPESSFTFQIIWRPIKLKEDKQWME